MDQVERSCGKLDFTNTIKEYKKAIGQIYDHPLNRFLVISFYVSSCF